MFVDVANLIAAHTLIPFMSICLQSWENNCGKTIIIFTSLSHLCKLEQYGNQIQLECKTSTQCLYLETLMDSILLNIKCELSLEGSYFQSIIL